MLVKSTLVLALVAVCNAVIRDYFTGEVVTNEQLAYYKKRGATACYADIKPCEGSEHEGRRVDGSCNNPKHPARGTYFCPLPRSMDAHYTNVDQSRKAQDGEELNDPRVIRLNLLHEERSYDEEFTQIFAGFPIFMFLDIGSVHDVRNNLFDNAGCCDRPNDKTCAPIFIRPDDAIYRYNNVTCLNMTMPLTHQHFGCTNDPITSPVQNATASFDMSQIYNYENEGDKILRSFKGGKLLVEKDVHGQIWPPNCEESHIKTRCPLNIADEKRCMGKHLNALLPINLHTIWFVRLHNYIAEILATLNPCWSDQKLFNVARDILIALASQILLYEWMVEAIGHQNLVRFGAVSHSDGFRDVYNEELYPTITLEYTYILRYFHVAQQGVAARMEPDGTIIEEYPITNLSFRPGYLEKDQHFAEITRGFVWLPGSERNHGIDYEIAHNGDPTILRSEDICAQDLKKGRLFGVAPYIDYLGYCFGAQIESFDDLRPYMTDATINKMRRLYKHPRDIDLLAGAWTEKFIRGGHIPQTVACLLSEGVAKNIRGDRHWYERPNRPHAFTKRQLKEIRKMTIASLLCSVGDGITRIQKRAFRTVTPENPIVSCDEIPAVDFSAWADESCARQSDCHEEDQQWDDPRMYQPHW